MGSGIQIRLKFKHDFYAIGYNIKEMPKCKLCIKDEADKKNSHIIPKFMGKRLFEMSQPRHSLRINIQGKFDKIQDTPKEDYIFCSRCEKRFARLEHYFSIKLTSINNYENEREKYIIKTPGNNTVLECLKIPHTGLKLFIYSLVWKTSVSSLFEFLKFKLPPSKEEELRIFLDSNLTESHSDLMTNFIKIKVDSNFDSFVFKCIVKNEYSRGIYTAYEFGEGKFGIFLVDFIIFYYIDNSKIPTELRLISDMQQENALIVMADIPRWKKINFAPLENIGKNYG